MKISAVIFDLDGTVLDNEDEYGKAFKKVLQQLGAKVESNFPHETGIGVKENWPKLLGKYHIKTNKSIEELTKETQDAYLEQLDKVTLKKGFVDFIKVLKERDILTAIATSNAWWIVEDVFDKFDLYTFFNAITTGEEVESRKPEPDLFLAAAEKLGVSPSECLVIEDSPAGIEAAHRAGMTAIGVARDKKLRQELKNAEMVIDNFIQLTPDLLKSES